jgi:hypothetical protein
MMAAVISNCVAETIAAHFRLFFELEWSIPKAPFGLFFSYWPIYCPTLTRDLNHEQ